MKRKRSPKDIRVGGAGGQRCLQTSYSEADVSLLEESIRVDKVKYDRGADSVRAASGANGDADRGASPQVWFMPG